MGEVYKATDTRLNRVVAIKVLPAHRAGDGQSHERFEREARTISQLDHPHICALYDVGEQDGTPFLVMQYLEGETLANRLTRGALPLADALTIGMQIADALARAHRAGIVHRDVKPSNIFLTKIGAKLLDFGLAKPAAAALAVATQIPTTPPVTADGAILGTIQYMAPEQLEGREADARSDIFGFGAVLYEMVTGRRAFEGRSQASVIAAILERDPPPMSSLQPVAPQALDRVVRMCLAKDPDARWQNAADLAHELGWIAVAGADTATPRVASPTLRRGVPAPLVVGLLVAAAALGVAFGLLRRTPSPEQSEIRFDITGARAPLVAVEPGMAVSPDGKWVATVALLNNRPALGIRALGEVAVQPLAGTIGAAFPFWSPDSRSIAFFADGQLKRIEISGGPPRPLVRPTTTARGGSWSAQGVIVFAPSAATPLLRVAATGGDVAPVTNLRESGASSHRFPFFLPDGRHLLFRAEGAAPGIYVADLNAPGLKRIIDGAATSPAFIEPDRLLFIRAGALMMQTFDARRLEIRGEPLRIADQINGFSASSTGVLAYRTGGAVAQSQLTWFDRSGRSLSTLGSADLNPQSVDLSPDGKQLATFRDDGAGQRSIWLVDTGRGVATRFTSDGLDNFPLWTPDGSRIVFTRTRPGMASAFFSKSLTSTDAGQVLFEAAVAGTFAGSDISRDGRILLYRAIGQNSLPDLFTMPLSGEKKPSPWITTAFDEFNGQFSPDSRWIAYASDETGRFEVYAQTFPTPGAKFQLSTDGGVEPRWRNDGKELFYLAPDGALTSVSVAAAADGRSLDIGRPLTLFKTTPLGGFANNVRHQYAVSRDGQRFLVNVTGTGDTSSITVRVNWLANAGR